MEFLCSLSRAWHWHALMPNHSSCLRQRIEKLKHLHCKHLFFVSMASDVLLKDGMLVITILCLLKLCGPGYYLDTMGINIGRAVTKGKNKGNTVT